MENNKDETQKTEKDDNDLTPELNEEQELLPPEEEAKQLNVGNIIAIILIVVVIIIVLSLFFSSKKKKTEKEKELEKSGTKTEVTYDFNKINPKVHTEENDEVLYVDEEQDDYEDESETKEESTDEILATLPDDLQINYTKDQTPSPAPISPVGSSNTSTSVSTRPETRGSKSPRKIEGIKGLEYEGNLLNGATTAFSQGFNTNPQYPNKSDYVDKQIDYMKQLQAPYMNNNQSQPQQYQTNKEQFFNNQGNARQGSFLSNSSLWDGTIISGALVTAINTDNPGIVIARVTENVWSSYDHSYLLIPEGSLLYATYNSSVNYGQDKVQVAWNLLIRPDGYRIELGNMNGVNAQGMSGYEGKVSNHPWETLKALGMVAVYSILQTEITGQIKDQNNEYIKNAITDVYAQTSTIGNRILDKALDIKPTITIKEGTEIKLITNTPLELPPVQIPQVSNRYVRIK